MVDLPNPTSDLDWSGFIGAIHDIFSANARKFPDRECVVETPTETVPERIFTYRQIDESSNILAHYLVDNGIERGDVVMVYAYRGVDLVVAIMGTLKAGATFSVIDPLYPPERQKIYLEVAQPKALVNIEKATIDAGHLSEIVRSYIDGSLQLKAEVPALRIDGDGSLAGGTIDGVDVFKNSRSKATQSPAVLVGPDSNPTLSFTSGSEGRPKGVLGRHYSLAYYFPWMSERFQLNEKDRFTMLSGVAHDPIQRDVFTPLFLGARLLVPSKEDIQHERLAEWMKNHGGTVTHLTPAMGQVLVGGATAEFPSLRRAFFVGDILTKRDCVLLRKLAENVNIVNMYGTTETQRAVSYFEIPSRAQDAGFLERGPDVIPTGRGMKNVQLLVVNREDKMKQCPIGEVGEIYVRAAGLAEGYLNDEAKNQEKFLTNWFVDPKVWIDADKKDQSNQPWRQLYKGPRDRLYRTGDLGRYLETGDVECTGRADDQVKIRGFRIELGEINSHLSQHSLIRDCVTLVRRDKDEEAKLVSYIVPETKRWPEFLASKGIEDSTEDDSLIGMIKRYRPLQGAIRDHLKRKLPAYAVPTHFIPLQKLPLNPNGKVDKPALPFPDIVEITSAASEESLETWNAMSETEQRVASLWGELIPGCNSKAINPNESFFDLGGHSILAQQLLLSCRVAFDGLTIPMASLFQNPTLKGYSAAIDKIRDTASGKAGVSSDVNGIDHGIEDYAGEAEKLAKELPASYPTAETLNGKKPLTAFLTGASGFLGSYLLRDLLQRTSPVFSVIAHVRAKSPEAGLQRLRDACRAYGVWKDEWSSRLSCVTGNLGDKRMGIEEASYKKLLDEVDVVIHNGAQVHWVYPYSTLRPANVLGTIDALAICASGKPKQLAFVSSTSTLDSDHYVNISSQGFSVNEGDDLDGSRTSLTTGYGQSKWVGEYLVKEAGRRGLRGTIIRAGYILGDSKSGATNTDDFLIRMLKGCVQLQSRPNISNTINMVPVDHVSRLVVACALHPPVAPLGVAQMTSHPRLTFNQLLASLEIYGYHSPQTSYEEWRDTLERYVSEGVQKDYEQHALMPLYHFVTNDLPANTRAPELEDPNAAKALKSDAAWTGEDLSAGGAVTQELVGRYLKFLSMVGFLKQPAAGKGKPLPDIEIAEGQRVTQLMVGGRGGAP